MGYFSFPHTRSYDSDLGWLIRSFNEISEKLDMYLDNAVIKIADPISWNITKQYEANTIVTASDGTAYISRQPVPAGVGLDNREYWLPVFNFSDITNSIMASIAVNLGDSNITPVNLSTADLVYSRNILYYCQTDIAAGSALIPGSNVTRTSVSQAIQAVRTLLINNIAALETADDLIRANIAVNEGDSTTASEARAVNDLVWLNDNLYFVEQPIAAGAAYIIGDNVTKTRVDVVINSIRSLVSSITNQIGVLQTQIDSAAARIDALETITASKQIVIIGDSYATGIGTAVTDSFVDIVKDDLSGLMTIYNCSKGGCGFGNPAPYNYMDALTETESIIPDKTKITEVWIIGGHNDLSYTFDSMKANAAALVGYIRTNYPNAAIKISAIGMTLNESLMAAWYTLPARYMNLADFTNVLYARGLEKLLSNSTFMDSDLIHPNQAGQDALAKGFKNMMLGDTPVIMQSIGSNAVTLSGGNVTFTEAFAGYWTRYGNKVSLYHTQTGFKPVMSGYKPANGSNEILLGELSNSMFFGNPTIYDDIKTVQCSMLSGGNYYAITGKIRFNGKKIYFYPLMTVGGNYGNYDANTTFYLMPNTLTFDIEC